MGNIENEDNSLILCMFILSRAQWAWLTMQLASKCRLSDCSSCWLTKVWLHTRVRQNSCERAGINFRHSILGQVASELSLVPSNADVIATHLNSWETHNHFLFLPFRTIDWWLSYNAFEGKGKRGWGKGALGHQRSPAPLVRQSFASP